MANLNRVLLLGNLTREVELRYTPKGTAVAEVGMAINEYRTDAQGNKQESTVFCDITLWGRTAEIAAEYCKKGDPLLVEGRLALDVWTDKQTDQKRSKLKVVGESIQLIGGKRDQSQDRDQELKAPSQRGTGTYRTQGAKPPPRPPADPDLDAGEDDIPF